VLRYGRSRSSRVIEAGTRKPVCVVLLVVHYNYVHLISFARHNDFIGRKSNPRSRSQDIARIPGMITFHLIFESKIYGFLPFYNPSSFEPLSTGITLPCRDIGYEVGFKKLKSQATRRWKPHDPTVFSLVTIVSVLRTNKQTDRQTRCLYMAKSPCIIAAERDKNLGKNNWKLSTHFSNYTEVDRFPKNAFSKFP